MTCGVPPPPLLVFRAVIGLLPFSLSMRFDYSSCIFKEAVSSDGVVSGPVDMNAWEYDYLLLSGFRPAGQPISELSGLFLLLIVSDWRDIILWGTKSWACPNKPPPIGDPLVDAAPFRVSGSVDLPAIVPIVLSEIRICSFFRAFFRAIYSCFTWSSRLLFSAERAMFVALSVDISWSSFDMVC